MAYKEAGITEEDVSIVQSSWEAVQDDMDKAGYVLFVVMFEMFPTYQNFFKRFKPPNSDLMSSSEIQPHIKGVMRTLNDIITRLKDEEYVLEKLKQLGESHKRRDVTSVQFNHIVEIVLETLRRVLGDKFTSEAEKSWNTILSVAMTVAGAAADK